MNPAFVRLRPLLVAFVVTCAAWLVLHEVRVVGFGGISLGPLSSRFAHDVMLLLAAGACLARGRAGPGGAARLAADRSRRAGLDLR